MKKVHHTVLTDRGTTNNKNSNDLRTLYNKGNTDVSTGHLPNLYGNRPFRKYFVCRLIYLWERTYVFFLSEYGGTDDCNTLELPYQEGIDRTVSCYTVTYYIFCTNYFGRCYLKDSITVFLESLITLNGSLLWTVNVIHGKVFIYIHIYST